MPKPAPFSNTRKIFCAYYIRGCVIRPNISRDGKGKGKEKGKGKGRETEVTFPFSFLDAETCTFLEHQPGERLLADVLLS